MNNKNISNIISVLRFPLCVLVIIQHSNFVFGIKSQGEILYIDSSIAIYFITFFSHILSHAAVPLFFFISGFLFTCNILQYNREVYKRKLKGRIYSLLIPYIIWNMIAIAYFGIKHLRIFKTVFPQYHGAYIDFGNMLSSIYVVNRENNLFAYVPQTPMDGPLWFIRDLFIMVLLIPLLFKLKHKIQVFLVYTCCVLWFFNIIPPFIFPGISTMGLTFFFGGLIVGSLKLQQIPKRWRNIQFYNVIIFGILSTVNLVTVSFNIDNGLIHIQHIPWIQNANIITGVILLISLANIVCHYKIASSIANLSNCTFFIFAFHNLINGNILSIFIKINKTWLSSSGLVVISVYVMYIFLTILISYFVYTFVCKFKITKKYIAVNK